jgi:hypothetical protein
MFGSVLFSEELDAVDEVFVEDAHESPRLLVSVADFLAQRLHDALVACAHLCPHCRKLASYFVPELDDMHFESRYARGQLLEELDSPFQHVYAFFERSLRHACLPGFRWLTISRSLPGGEMCERHAAFIGCPKDDDDTIVFALTTTPISAERRAIDLAATHIYLRDPPGVVDVVERVGVKDDEVGTFAGSDGAELIELERLG